MGEPISYAGGAEVAPDWVGTYSYETPPTGITPAPGEIIHSDNVLGRLNFALLDLNGNTYSGVKLVTGATITIGGTVYTLTAPPQDFGSYYSIPISPETQRQPGVFPVTTAAPAPLVQPLMAKAKKGKRK